MIINNYATETVVNLNSPGKSRKSPGHSINFFNGHFFSLQVGFRANDVIILKHSLESGLK